MSKWNKYKEDRKQWRKDNPDKIKKYKFKEKCAKYGITPENYYDLLEEQEHTCSICGYPETRIDHRTKQVTMLAIDHDHTTGSVRGLLCSNCNLALGLFQDNTDTILAAYKYILKHTNYK